MTLITSTFSVQERGFMCDYTFIFYVIFSRVLQEDLLTVPSSSLRKISSLPRVANAHAVIVVARPTYS